MGGLLQPQLEWSRWATALVVALGFSVVARVMRGVNRSGAIAGAAVSFLIYGCAGPAAFATLVWVFVLTLLATRMGYARKLRSGTAEKGSGRTASQVIANTGVAVIAGLVFARRGESAFLAGLVAALAEVAADTVSSECGQAAESQARLITTWKSVPPGTNGAISLAGTIAGSAAALLVGLASAGLRLVPLHLASVAAAAGVIGMLVDSLLGATLEHRRLLNNNAVNFLGTLSAALIAIGWARI
ncbi:MAG TPA: DUF92 domain-containing protein [Terriglobales bacterium]|jgi:uncharacterized protein (TIGR00297 family)